MNDGAVTDSAGFGLEDAAAVSGADHRPSSYCGGCGTWDAHGFTCMSCGYDFTPETGGAPSDD